MGVFVWFRAESKNEKTSTTTEIRIEMLLTAHQKQLVNSKKKRAVEKLVCRELGQPGSSVPNPLRGQMCHVDPNKKPCSPLVYLATELRFLKTRPTNARIEKQTSFEKNL